MTTRTPRLRVLMVWAAIAFACVAAGCSGSGSGSAALAPRATAVPAEVTLDLGGGVTMKMVLIPAGKFMMGSPDSEKGREENEGPQHEVTISKPFYMGVTEVTHAQYQAVIGVNPSMFRGGGATLPVESVSWGDATEFCEILSRKTRQAVRLPTEAEWEYACRAGTQTAYSFGHDPSALGDYAWWGENCAMPSHLVGNAWWAKGGYMPHPVGQKKPNAWGLYDMHGNVFEWCADPYGAYPEGPVTDPSGAAAGGHVVRGGTWRITNTDRFRCAYRVRCGMACSIATIGFRCAMTLR